MGYKTPTLEQLQKLASTLRDEYKGGNKDRLSFITLIEKLTKNNELMESDDAVNILMGASIFEMEHIANSYHLGTPEGNWMYNGSGMYRLIKAGLEIDAGKDNAPTDVRKLIYLSAFYNYLKDQAPENLVENTTWHTNQALQTPVLDTLKLVLNKQQPHIDCLLSKYPEFDKIKGITKKIKANYERISPPGWFSGGEWIKEARFIDLINQYCEKFVDKLYPQDESNAPYMLRMASMVYAMKVIEGPAGYFKFKTGSSLHQMCNESLPNTITKTADLDVSEKGAWLSSLALHVQEMKDMKYDKKYGEFLKEAEKNGYKNVRQELESVLAKLYEQLGVIYEMKNAPNAIEAKMIDATSGAAQYGLRALLMRSPIAIVSGLAVDAAVGGIAGFAFFGPGGALLGTTLSRLVRTHIIPLAVASMFAGLLGKIGKRVGKDVTHIVAVPFVLTKDGLTKLYEWYRNVEVNPEELRHNEKWIKALMKLPDDVFNADSKKVIENLYGNHDNNNKDVTSNNDDEEPLRLKM